MIKIFPFEEQKIVDLYTKEHLSAREVKEKLKLDISTRQIQRILKKRGVIRLAGDAFRLSVVQNKVTYYHKPAHLKQKRLYISTKQRYRIFERDGFRCKLCGSTPEDGIRLEIDHKDENPLNNTDENLQVICNICNRGKSAEIKHD